jgi:hypothetical protein
MKSPRVAIVLNDYESRGRPTIPLCRSSTRHLDGHLWVAPTLSQCTSVKYSGVSSNSAIIEGTKFAGPHNPVCKHFESIQINLKKWKRLTTSRAETISLPKWHHRPESGRGPSWPNGNRPWLNGAHRAQWFSVWPLGSTGTPAPEETVQAPAIRITQRRTAGRTHFASSQHERGTGMPGN